MRKNRIFCLILTTMLLASCASTKHPDVVRANELMEELLKLQETCHERWQEAMITEIGSKKPLSSHEEIDKLDLLVRDCFQPKQRETLEKIKDLYCPHRPGKEICEGWKKEEESPPG